jgi:hypothetical protein
MSDNDARPVEPEPEPEPKRYWVTVHGSGAVGPFGGHSYTMDAVDDALLDADGTLVIRSVWRNGAPVRIVSYPKGSFDRWVVGPVTPRTEG